jgi:flagellar hook-associated protein 3 FlgL
MRIDPHYVNNLVSSLNDIGASQQKITQQMSSGSRLTSLADDPLAAGQNSSLSSAIDQADIFIKTASTVSSRMQAADSALGSVVTNLTSAISTAVQGSNGTLNPADVQAVAQKLSSIRDTLLSLANSSYQGAYLFGGSSGATQPFTLNSSTTPAAVTYAGDAQTSSLTSTTGQVLQTSIAGSAVFGTGTSSDVFASLNNLIADFASGTPSASVTQDIGALRDSLSNVTQQRSILDSSMTRLDAASTYASTQETDLSVAQTKLISADTASLATQLAADTTQRSALLSTIAIVQKGSLFDYL